MRRLLIVPLAAMREAGVTSVRLPLNWAGIVPDAADRRDPEWWWRTPDWRYGPRGSFWRENPELPPLPVRQWEIWNEENIVTFSRQPDPERFARLIRISGQLLHRLDPGSTVIMGGLFGRPLQIPPNIASDAFLAGVSQEFCL